MEYFKSPEHCVVPLSVLSMFSAWFQQAHKVSMIIIASVMKLSANSQGQNHELEVSQFLKEKYPNQDAQRWLEAMSETTILGTISQLIHLELYSWSRTAMLNLQQFLEHNAAVAA